MVIYKEEMMQRPLNYAIIDEVDSILIDEARTPLIISGQGSKSTDMYAVADRFAKTLINETDFTIEEKTRLLLLLKRVLPNAKTTSSLTTSQTLKIWK